MITETGWLCRNGQLLNACCMTCRVWITEDRREFDERPHQCPKQKYAITKAKEAKREKREQARQAMLL